MTSLAADIGGTYSRLAWLEDCRPKAEQVFGNAEFDSLEAATAWADSDPYVDAGVFSRVTVKPYNVVLP